MNLIVCSKDCNHQEDGYCVLNGAAQLSSSLDSKCGYYKSRDNNTAPALDISKKSSKDFERLG